MALDEGHDYDHDEWECKGYTDQLLSGSSADGSKGLQDDEGDLGFLQKAAATALVFIVKIFYSHYY